MTAGADWYGEVWPHPGWKPSQGPTPVRRRGGQPRGGRTHGKAGTYARGCRCDDCREAATLAQRKRRESA